jgi:hypothetical protein
MFYKQFLRVRGALVCYAIVLAILLGVSTLITMSTSKVDLSIGAGAAQAATVTHATIQSGATPWLVLLALAGFSAAIMATVLGSSLAQENDHLEVACTKPCSRATYATGIIAIDLGAILISLAIALACGFAGFAVIASRTGAHLISEPDATANIARFVLFPLAWYAVIAGLSAGMRSKASVVQGLIWPVAMGMVGLREVPLGGIWHNIFVALNAINPLIYISYQSKADVVIVGASPLHVLWSTLILAAFVVVGWFAATTQWRRVEA